MPAVRETGLLSSLCTIVVAPEATADSDAFDAGGALKPDAEWPPLEGHEDLECTAPPMQTSENMTATEMRSMRDIEAKGLLHVLLGGYYPEIPGPRTDGPQCRAMIRRADEEEDDAIAYDVVNVESDSQGQMTRLALQRVTM